MVGEVCPTCGPRTRWRGSAAARGYDKAWSHLAADFRARFPFCGQRADGLFHVEHSVCTQNGRRVLAQCVDHIVPIRDGGEIYNEANLQSLCYRCNAIKR